MGFCELFNLTPAEFSNLLNREGIETKHGTSYWNPIFESKGDIYYKNPAFHYPKVTPKKKTGKEFLYVGHYTDTKGRFILKIGTTNNLERRQKEHTRAYQKAPDYTMPSNSQFEYDWTLPLSKYNTLRYEDKNRQVWQQIGVGEFVRNDRFYCSEKPSSIPVKIRKEYVVEIK